MRTQKVKLQSYQSVMAEKTKASNENIIYQKLTPNYLEEACLVVRKTIFTGGNVSRAVNLSNDLEALSESVQLPKLIAEDGLSFIAIDKITNRVVGVAFNKLMVKNENFLENVIKILKNHKARQIVKFLIESDKKTNILDRYKVNCLMEIVFLGTLPEYRKKGIAKNLFQLSVDAAKCSTVKLPNVPQGVYAVCTSFISQKIGKDLGFDEVAEFSNTKLEIDGKILENPNAETPVTKVIVKMFE